MLILDAVFIKFSVTDGDPNGIRDCLQNIDDAFIKTIFAMAHDAQDADDCAARVHRSHRNRTEMFFAETGYGVRFSAVEIIVSDHCVLCDDFAGHAFAHRNSHWIGDYKIMQPAFLCAQNKFVRTFVDEANAARFRPDYRQHSLQGCFECFIKIKRIAYRRSYSVNRCNLVNATFNFF
jgi:hypothetical protein